MQSHIAKHAAAQDAGQFTPWYRKPATYPSPATRAAILRCDADETAARSREFARNLSDHDGRTLRRAS